MNLTLYNLFLHTVVAPFLIVYYGPRIAMGRKYRRSLGGKLGRPSRDFVPELLGRPRLWFHAVSVGEVVALAPLVEAMKQLMPAAAIIVSTGTETGQDKARELIRDADGFLYLPIDFPECVGPVVRRIRPDLFVLMETELWPNLVHSLRRTGAAIALANGRISDRSFPRYRRLRGFFSTVLKEIDLFLMTSDLDARRIEEMGASTARIHVTGNTKFDALPGATEPHVESRMRELLGLDSSDMVMVAGSTHPGEHEIVLDAFLSLARTFPELILVIVPRHVEKTPSVVSAMRERNMAEPFLRSSADNGETRGRRSVVIVDRTGELFQVYSLASVVFIGGSLVPRGGQNILEPAAWGKMVLFGPSMEDFRDARDILVAQGAGIQISGLEDLTRHALWILSNPQEAARLGAQGREAMLANVGSARRNADLLSTLSTGRTYRTESRFPCG